MFFCYKTWSFLTSFFFQISKIHRCFDHINDLLKDIGCLEVLESKGSFRGQGFIVVDIGSFVTKGLVFKTNSNHNINVSLREGMVKFIGMDTFSGLCSSLSCAKCVLRVYKVEKIRCRNKTQKVTFSGFLS